MCKYWPEALFLLLKLNLFFFFFCCCPLLCRICSDDDEQMNWSHNNNQENQSNVSLTSYCKNLHLFILFCIDNLN